VLQRLAMLFTGPPCTTYSGFLRRRRDESWPSGLNRVDPLMSVPHTGLEQLIEQAMSNGQTLLTLPIALTPRFRKM
jgi:hypothetical protein